MPNKAINIDGMTCGHCAHAATGKLSHIAGVTSVNIDLHPGEVSPVAIDSDIDLSDSDIAAAVEEAGYTIVSP